MRFIMIVCNNDNKEHNELVCHCVSIVCDKKWALQLPVQQSDHLITQYCVQWPHRSQLAVCTNDDVIYTFRACLAIHSVILFCSILMIK